MMGETNAALFTRHVNDTHFYLENGQSSKLAVVYLRLSFLRLWHTKYLPACVRQAADVAGLEMSKH